MLLRIILNFLIGRSVWNIGRFSPYSKTTTKNISFNIKILSLTKFNEYSRNRENLLIFFAFNRLLRYKSKFRSCIYF